MRRRTLLGTSAAAVGGGGVAVGLTRWLAAPASAEIALDVDGDAATVADGEEVTRVGLSVDIDWHYEVPDSASPSAVIVELAAGVDDVAVIADAESAQLFTEADGSESFEVDLLEDVLDPEPQETDVTIEARMRVEDAAADELASAVASDVATVVIDAAGDATASVDGEGVITIETE